MKNTFHPMLAATLMPSDAPCNDTTVMQAMKQLRYPVLASVKLDGIRALRMEMPILASRTLKWIPNESLQARALSLPIGYDMELWSPSLDYNEIQGIVMGEKDDASKIEFHVLDDYTAEFGYEFRISAIRNTMSYKMFTQTVFEMPTLCEDADELFAFEAYCIQQHSEGICFRIPDSPYKQGRSTLREQYLVKHCRYTYEDCEIIGFIEQMSNDNKEKRNDLGYMKRSSSIVNMTPKGTLGAFLVRNLYGVEFSVGTGQGLTDSIRQHIWMHQDKYLGGQCIIKSKAHGVKNKPRSPIFWGFRDKGF